MSNPFAEEPDSADADAALVEAAQQGNREALETLIRNHQGWIYNIALRMVWEPEDAQDVTQEVLIKIVTKLGTFQGQSRFRTWLYRIVVNHVITMKRRSKEEPRTTFEDFRSALEHAPDQDLPDPKSVPVDLKVLVDEAKIGCTTAMLLCLDREQRLTFVLGEVFGATDRVGGELLDISPENFRQRLARARRDLYGFMHQQCGLINSDNPCRCAKKTRAFMDQGFVDARKLRFVPTYVTHIGQIAAERTPRLAELLDRQYAAIFREHPVMEPRDLVEPFRRMLDSQEFRGITELES